MTSAPKAPAAGRVRREPLSRADWIVTALFANVAIGGTVGLISIRGHLPSLQEQIGGLRAEMNEEIGGLERQIAGIRQDVREMQREIQSLSGRMRAVEERLGGIETVLRIHHGPLPRP